MRTVYEREIANASKIEGQIRQGRTDMSKSPVGPVCKALWPDKPDVEVAIICGCDPRNARRYMSGELPIPSILASAILVELTRRR